MREAILLACAPYSKKHQSVNIADWVMVRKGSLASYFCFYPDLLIFQSTVDEWDIRDRLRVITTDNAANMLGIFNVEGFPPNYKSGPCVNHIIQLAINVSYFV